MWFIPDSRLSSLTLSIVAEVEVSNMFLLRGAVGSPAGQHKVRRDFGGVAKSWSSRRGPGCGSAAPGREPAVDRDSPDRAVRR